MCQLVDNSFKSYMDYRAITNTSSRQYELISQANIVDGLLYIDDHVLVAMGSYYGEVGTRYKITLDSGETFLAIKGDAKSDNDVVNGCYHAHNNSILEFIVDTQTLDDSLRSAGNIDGLFTGNIVKIEREE